MENRPNHKGIFLKQALNKPKKEGTNFPKQSQLKLIYMCKQLTYSYWNF